MNAANRKLRGVHPDARALIEGMQPYQLGSDFASHELFLLYDLARIDRHRLLHPMVAYFSGFGIKPSSSSATVGPGAIHSFGGLLNEERTEVGRLEGVRPIRPSERVYVDAVVPLSLGFPPESGVAAGKNVVETLGGIYNYIVTNVLPPLEPFLS